jgi:hypothetical protein
MIPYLQIGRAVIEQLEHVSYILSILYNKVELHVELAAHQLKQHLTRLVWKWC